MLLLLLLILSCAHASTSLPQHFISTIVTEVDNTRYDGKIWFDFKLKGIVLTFEDAEGAKGKAVGTPYRNETILYGLTNAPSCEILMKILWTALPISWVIPGGCINSGETIINGTKVESWYCTREQIPILYDVTFYLNVANNAFVFINATIPSPGIGAPISFLMSFSNTTLNPIDPSIFKKPEGC